MNLQQIIQFERSLNALAARLSPCLEPDMRGALEQARAHAAEVRHFAVCWQDAQEVEASAPEKARDLRDEAITRLVNTFRPC